MLNGIKNTELRLYMVRGAGCGGAGYVVMKMVRGKVQHVELETFGTILKSVLFLRERLITLRKVD